MIPDSFPRNRNPITKKTVLKMVTKLDADTAGKIWFSTTARPVTPPVEILLGNLKKKTPIATSRMPKEMTAYSFTTSQTFFFVSTILIVTTVPFHRKN